MRRARSGRRSRIGAGFVGFINSAVRTLTSVYFIAISFLFYYISNTAKSLDWLVTILNKFKLTTISSWISSNHEKSSAIIYILLLSFTILPSNLSVFYTVVGIAIIYYLSKLSVASYIVLFFFLTWFARTRSSKIKLFIFLVFMFTYASGWWGADIASAVP